MKSYFDTSVLLPVLVSLHPAHQQCLSCLEKAMQQGSVITASHTCAELYSNMTKLPFNLSIPPRQAVRAIDDGFATILTFIDLTRSDYEAALHRCATLGLTSGIIYDALHVQAAIKAGVDVLYTANLRDFHRLLTPEVAFEVKGVA